MFVCIVVKHLHVALDDDTFERLKDAKEKHGGSWEDLLVDEILPDNNNDN